MAYTRTGWVALAITAYVLAGCASAGGSKPGGGGADFVGHRWRITAVQHRQSHFTIPPALGAWIEFKSHGGFGADDGVNGYGGSFKRTHGGFRVGGDVVGSAVGVAGPGGAPASTLAVVEAIRQIIDNRPEVNADVTSGRLQLSVADYQITGVPSAG